MGQNIFIYHFLPILNQVFILSFLIYHHIVCKSPNITPLYIYYCSNIRFQFLLFCFYYLYVFYCYQLTIISQMLRNIVKGLTCTFTSAPKLSAVEIDPIQQKQHTLASLQPGKRHQKIQINFETEKFIKPSENIYWGYANKLAEAFSFFEGQRGLYEIAPINKRLNKNILSMAYTPGVGAVCKQIEKNPDLTDILTMRGRSVAIVTQGNCLKQKIEPGKIAPVVDWCIAQIKYYSGIDCYPFIVRHGANMTNVLKDLSNTYGTILLLDPKMEFKEEEIPKDVTIIDQENITRMNGRSIIDCQDTARILNYILNCKKKGVIRNQQILKEGLKFDHQSVKKQTTHFSLFRDGRSIGEKSCDFHRKFQGKIHIQLNFSNMQKLKESFTEDNLIRFCQNQVKSNGYRNTSAIVTDGTAILGFGDIGPKAGLPVMEGKSLLFKVLGGVNVVPICINKRKTPQQTVEAIMDISTYFKAINLEDIKAPQCFHIERSIQEKKIIPVFHDDQHGTAIVTVAALINALKLADKKMQDVKIVISGVGAAGISTCRLLNDIGVQNIIMADTKGAIYEGRKQGMNKQKQVISQISNKYKIKGSIGQIIKGADVFIGVSGPGTLTKQMAKTMNKKSIIFALANPDPQITLNDALEAGAFIYGSGRSDFKNQINNSLVFPGIFRGIHEHGLSQITNQMKLQVAKLIAQNIDRTPTQRYIVIDSLDLDIPVLIANSLKKFKKQN